MNDAIRRIGQSLSSDGSPSNPVTHLGMRALPYDYTEFIHAFNGAEGAIGRHGYLALWRVEDLAQHNSNYGVDEFWPGFVFFGSNGGGVAFAYNYRDSPPTVWAVPFDSIDPQDATLVARNFAEFLMAHDLG